ncbi:MAG: LCP family protein [Oscillospiraceae bacterium]|jgi:hypothetical protein|nr:LCP family protein [Oscillospiraceae bacterium]
MSGEKYDLEFRPKEKGRRDFILRFMIGFGSIALLLLVVSAIVLQKDGLIDQILASYRPTEAASEPEQETWPHTGNAVFVLAGTDYTGQKMRFAALVLADAATRQLVVKPLEPRAKLQWNGQETTLEKAVAAHGAKALRPAAEALAGMRVDRYICADDAGFVRAVNRMGSVTVEVPQRIRFNGADFTLTLAAGTQRLQGDMLLRYFRYLGTQKTGAAHAQAVLLAHVLQSCLQPNAALSTPEALETRYNALADCLQTDISVEDFVNQSALLIALLQDGAVRAAAK